MNPTPVFVSIGHELHRHPTVRSYIKHPPCIDKRRMPISFTLLKSAAVCLPTTYTFSTFIQTDSYVLYLYLLPVPSTMYFKSDPPYLSSLNAALFSLTISYIKEYHIRPKVTRDFMYFFVHKNRVFRANIQIVLCILLYSD